VRKLRRVKKLRCFNFQSMLFSTRDEQNTFDICDNFRPGDSHSPSNYFRPQQSSSNISSRFYETFWSTHIGLQFIFRVQQKVICASRKAETRYFWLETRYFMINGCAGVAALLIFSHSSHSSQPPNKLSPKYNWNSCRNRPKSESRGERLILIWGRENKC